MHVNLNFQQCNDLFELDFPFTTLGAIVKLTTANWQCNQTHPTGAWYTIQAVQTEYNLNNEYQTDNVKVSNQSSLVLELGLWNLVKMGDRKKATDQAIEHMT